MVHNANVTVNSNSDGKGKVSTSMRTSTAATPASAKPSIQSLYNREQPWDLGDGLSRWARGVNSVFDVNVNVNDGGSSSSPWPSPQVTRLLFTLVKPDWFTYVVGAHIKHVHVTPERGVEVVRVFQPGPDVEGITLIEGNPQMQVFVLGQVGFGHTNSNANAITVYRADDGEDVLLATLPGQPDYDYLSVQFLKEELLLVLTGSPHFTIFLWKWATEEQLIAVKTLQGVLSTGIVISPANLHHWAEWSSTHLTFYELQEYTENSVAMTEIEFLPNVGNLLYPDETRPGEQYLYDIISVAWTNSGDLFALSNFNGIYRVDVHFHHMRLIGQLDQFFGPDSTYGDVSFNRIVPYDKSCLGALSNISGLFLVLQIRGGKLLQLGKINFGSQLLKFIPNPLPGGGGASKTSFYVLTEADHDDSHSSRSLHSVSNGRPQHIHRLADLLLSQIRSAAFLERGTGNATPDFVAVVTEQGSIFILDAVSGNVLTEWSFSTTPPLIACSIKCHPILPYVAVGSANGSVYYIDFRSLRKPKIIHQVYVMRCTLDILEWTARGRLLIAADSNEGYLFMLNGYATTEFEYLDCAHVAGYIRAINSPPPTPTTSQSHQVERDERLQVVSDYHRSDEVPFLVNTFRLNEDSFELVSSQLIEAPISSIAFSPFDHRQLLAFSYTSRKLGLVHYQEDTQAGPAGPLKEPHLFYDTKEKDTSMVVNQILIVGNRLFTFGANGLVKVFNLPDPTHLSPAALTKSGKLPPLKMVGPAVKTHLAANGGIREGIVSMNGAILLTFGFDNSITCVRLADGGKQKRESSLFGYDEDFTKVIEVQKKYYEALATTRHLQDTKHIEGSQGIIWELNQAEEEELRQVYSAEKEGIRKELVRIRRAVKRLIDKNQGPEEIDYEFAGEYDHDFEFGGEDYRRASGPQPPQWEEEPDWEDDLDQLDYLHEDLADDSDEEEERVPEEVEVFEVNEVAHEEMYTDFKTHFTHMKIVLNSLYELRAEWLRMATRITYHQFSSPICTIRGLNESRLVANYVQPHLTQEFIHEVIGVKNTRRLEQKLKRASFQIYEHAMELHGKWAALEERMKRRQGKNLPVDLEPRTRRALEEMALQTPGGLPAPPQHDFYGELLQQAKEELLQRARALQAAEEEDEVSSSDLSLFDVGSRASVDVGVGRAKPAGMAVSRFDQLVAAGTTTGLNEDDEDEDEEEARARLDPARIKRILDATGIPMSPQALAAFGLISEDIAWQLRDDEVELAQEKALELREKERHRKYTPKQKRANRILDQMRTGVGSTTAAAGRQKARLNLFDRTRLGTLASDSKLTLRSGLTSATASESTVASSEDEEEEEEAPPEHKKHRPVVKGLDPVTGQEIVELEVDSSDESEDDNADDDLELVEERQLAETAIKPEDWDRYQQLTRALSGNLTWKLYPNNLVFYAQTELFSVQQIRSQMILIQAEILKLQDVFNERFEAAKEFKQDQVKGIASRNQRIAEIYAFFGKRPPDYDYDWICHCEDETTRVFNVRDSEVPYEGSGGGVGSGIGEAAEAEAAAREKARLEEEEEEEDAIIERDRELLEMRMDATLEKKRERERLLREEVPKPEFMARKEQWEWNYDEYVKADEYFHQLEKHEKLRSAFKHELALELRKILRENKRARRLVDHVIHALLSYKINVERCIRLEELKWARLQRRLFEYFRLLREYDEKKRTMEKEQTKIKYTQEVTAGLVTRVDECAHRFDEIVERDHQLEMTFREDMGRDVSKFHMEQFVKLYRKRPKLVVPRSQLLQITLTMIKALQTPNLRWFAHENGELGQKAVNAIYEFDNPFFNPPACPRTTWERFVHVRRERLMCEYEAKTVASELVQLQSALEECDDRIEEFSESLAEVLSEVANHRQLMLEAVHDVEIQFVMKNGRVELPRTLVYEDFQDAVLIPAEDVGGSNTKVGGEGARKLKTLARLKRVHSQLKQSEYKYRRAELAEKHLRLQQRDILQLRVSKEILEFLRAPDYDSFKQEQEQKMERVAVFREMAERFHKRFLATYRRLTGMFKRQVARKEEDNETKDTLLDERNLKVNMELNSCVRQNPELVAKFHAERVEMLMELGAMMRGVGANAGMICQLETELDRLYHKTYPIL